MISRCHLSYGVLVSRTIVAGRGLEILDSSCANVLHTETQMLGWFPFDAVYRFVLCCVGIRDHTLRIDKMYTFQAPVAYEPFDCLLDTCSPRFPFSEHIISDVTFAIQPFLDDLSWHTPILNERLPGWKMQKALIVLKMKYENAVVRNIIISACQNNNHVKTVTTYILIVSVGYDKLDVWYSPFNINYKSRTRCVIIRYYKHARSVIIIKRAVMSIVS